MGVILAAVLYVPSLQDGLPLGNKPFFRFGRLWAADVKMAIFCLLSQVYVGGILYILPRLTRVYLLSERLINANWLGVESYGSRRASYARTRCHARSRIR